MYSAVTSMIAVIPPDLRALPHASTSPKTYGLISYYSHQPLFPKKPYIKGNLPSLVAKQYHNEGREEFSSVGRLRPGISLEAVAISNDGKYNEQSDLINGEQPI